MPYVGRDLSIGDRKILTKKFNYIIRGSKLMAKLIRVSDAIQSLNPSAKIVVLDNTNIDDPQITWVDGTSEIALADIKTEMERLQAIEDTK